MATVSRVSLIKTCERRLEEIKAVQASGFEYDTARRIVDAAYSEKFKKASCHRFALDLIKVARRAKEKGITKSRVWFNGMCYGLWIDTDNIISYVPLFGREKISAKELGGYSAMNAAFESAIRTANAGQWPYK